jgi:adenylate cyclase
MTQDGSKRKLAAILSADVKGYSLLLANDEAFTIRTLKKYREIMSKCIEQHNGRVVDSPGDNLLSEFSSVVDAVQCAVEIQKQLKKENEHLDKNKRLEFRIGVNIGDIVQDEGRIYGKGVNVAARIEGLANAGEVCISRNVYDHVKDKLEFGFVSLGEHEVKNIKEPIRVYKVLLEADSSATLMEEPLELSDKPSVAVLPFDNMSGDPGQEYFSDGLTEQIINGLCKVSNLFVVARNSSFAYKKKSISIKQIARELGVRYILEGSVQRAGDRVRITAQLIDATTEYHMWSENYDRDLSDIFALQDEITIKLIKALAVNLTHGEQVRLHYKDISSIQAFDKLARGLDYFYHSNKQHNVQARGFFEQASKLEETSAFAYSLLGWTHLMDLFNNWSESPLESFVEAEKNAQKALALNDSHDTPNILLGWIHLFKREYDKAIAMAKQAVALNPNGADALAHLGFISAMAGEQEEAIRNLKKAFRLNPIPPIFYYHFLGAVYHDVKKYNEAIEILNQGISIDSETLTPYPILISCYIELNQFDEARRSSKKVLEIDPDFSLAYYKDMQLLNDQAANDRYIENLRKAGLPD